MEVAERMRLARRALSRLHEILERDPLTEVERDALIKRFEFSFEILWKCAKDYLYEVDGVDAASPKKVIRSSRESGLLGDEETRLALLMTDDRNLASRTYDEEFAAEFADRVKHYEPVLLAWLDRMEKGRGIIDETYCMACGLCAGVVLADGGARVRRAEGP